MSFIFQSLQPKINMSDATNLNVYYYIPISTIVRNEGTVRLRIWLENIVFVDKQNK